jgi:hypothetical protein
MVARMCEETPMRSRDLALDPMYADVMYSIYVVHDTLQQSVVKYSQNDKVEPLPIAENSDDDEVLQEPPHKHPTLPVSSPTTCKLYMNSQGGCLWPPQPAMKREDGRKVSVTERVVKQNMKAASDLTTVTCMLS